MPITSSMTAAPRIVEPSRVRSAPSSISVCAEMLTLVAVRIVPMKTPSQNTREAECRSGRDAAEEGQDHAAEGGPEGHRADAPHLLEIGLEAGDEHQEEDADFREVADQRARPGRRSRRRAASRARRGASGRAAGRRGSRRIRPAGRSRLAAAPAALAAAITSARSSRTCRAWRHLKNGNRPRHLDRKRSVLQPRELRRPCRGRRCRPRTARCRACIPSACARST